MRHLFKTLAWGRGYRGKVQKGCSKGPHVMVFCCSPGRCIKQPSIILKVGRYLMKMVGSKPELGLLDAREKCVTAGKRHYFERN